MNTRNIAILGLVIVLFSLILPWIESISLLEFYFSFIVAIFSGLGLFLGSVFTVSGWRDLAQIIALVAYPFGIWFAYKSIKTRNPSIYQGIAPILAGSLMITSLYTAIPTFTTALGPYIAIIGGLVLELAWFMSGMNKHHTKHHQHHWNSPWLIAIAILVIIVVAYFFISSYKGTISWPAKRVSGPNSISPTSTIYGAYPFPLDAYGGRAVASCQTNPVSNASSSIECYGKASNG